MSIFFDLHKKHRLSMLKNQILRFSPCCKNKIVQYHNMLIYNL